MTIKKKTIFKLFIVPLILVMVVQSMISYGTFFFSGTPFLLKEYSVGILNQTVENRRILLENNMVQRWSDLEEEVSVANSTMERIVQNRERTPEKFLRSNSMQKEFLQAMVDTCLSVMRKNTVTGSFLILANDQVGGDDTVCQGIYFRDSDPVTEQRIRKAMLTITEGRTSFIIAHRLSTIRDSDLILLMENGQIAERGTHEELMAQNGRYAQMYRTQMGEE